MNYYSIQGTYLLSHRKRRIAKKHTNLYRKEYSKFSHKGHKIYLYRCYSDGFVVYSCKPYKSDASIAYSEAAYFRKMQLASRKNF